MKRYESADDRARALYRIPTAPNGNRTLELYHFREPLLQGFDWPGDGATLFRVDAQEPLPFADQSFDLVIVHRTLDELAAADPRAASRFDATPLLSHVWRVLAPGGLISGCVDNRSGLNSISRVVKRLTHPAQRAPVMGPFNQRRLQLALSNAKFAESRLFTLLPDSASPFKLVDVDAVISRAAFRHEVQIARQLTSPSGYVLRRLAVELGLYRRLERSIFFWAQKQPC